MNIVRGTVQEWTSLEKIKTVFEKKGFEDIEEDNDGLVINIVDSEDFGKEFLKIIKITDDYQKYYRYLEGAAGTSIAYLLLIKNFEEFVFVRETITTLGKKRIEKFKFSREDPKWSSLNKLNNLTFNNLDSFENLFDTKAVVDEFYKEYQENRDKLVSRIQGIKEVEDQEKYAQILFDRFIFLHFIQEKGFLSADKHFLINKYEQIRKEKKNYFEDFLKFLFFDVLNTPMDKRDLRHIEYNNIPFLNGGLFREHRIEHDNPKIWIGDDILKEIIDFLGKWSWYVDENSDFGEDMALSPEILGHIFEKTITGQKGKGAFYTPDTITDYVSENTIYPYILNCLNKSFNKNYNSLKEVIQNENVTELSCCYFDILKKIRILDDAVGSGAFLLAAQKILVELYLEIWGKIKDAQLPIVIAEKRAIQKYSSLNYYFRKYAITRNLFGVDIEEGAVEICKLRMWLSLVSDFSKREIEPLPNIDYQIQCGNSLIGLTCPPQVENVTLDNLVPIKQILADIHKLKEKFSYENDPDKSKKMKEDIDLRIKIENDVLRRKIYDMFRGKKIDVTQNEIEKMNPFNWALHFSEIFSNVNKDEVGFDIIIGNPPWEIFKPVEKEFFSAYDSRLTKYGVDKKEARRIIEKLKKDKAILEQWLLYERTINIEGEYYKKSEEYGWQSDEINGKQVGGDLNLYKLFVERSYKLLKKDGYCGIITPSGVYTDAGTKGLRRLLFDNARVDHLYCFENTKGIFESVHRSFKFVVLIYQKSRHTENFNSGFMWHDVSNLKDPQKHGIKIEWQLVKKLSPSSYSIIELKNNTDLSIIIKMYKHQLLSTSLNGMTVKFSTDFHMTNDSNAFNVNKNGLRLFEGKMIKQYGCDFSDPTYYVTEREAKNRFSGQPNDFEEHRLAFRAVASSTNRRSMIATILPKKVFVGNSLIVTKIFQDKKRLIDVSTLLYLCGVFNSRILDYLLRLKITTNLNMFFIYELPIPRPTGSDENYRTILESVGKLICISDEFLEISKQLKINPAKYSEIKKQQYLEKIEEAVRLLYGLSIRELNYIKSQFKNDAT